MTEQPERKDPPMHFEPSPEAAALTRLHSAIAEVADPDMQFDDEQTQSLGVMLAMLRRTVEQRTEQVTPTFEDYQSARAHAWVTGSVSATVNATTYVKAVDSHGIRECDASGPDGSCARCRTQYRRHYGYPRSAPQNSISGHVTGSVIQARDLGNVQL